MCLEGFLFLKVFIIVLFLEVNFVIVIVCLFIYFLIILFIIVENKMYIRIVFIRIIIVISNVIWVSKLGFLFILRKCIYFFF